MSGRQLASLVVAFGGVVLLLSPKLTGGEVLAGVNWVTVGLPTSSRSAYLDALDHFAATFLPREGR